jgi:AAA+ superfamily predicted ATPase
MIKIAALANEILQRKTQHGLSSVSVKYSGLMVPMAQYVLTGSIKEDPPRILTDQTLTKKAQLVDVEIDVNKTMPALDNISAIYEDKIIHCASRYNGQEFDVSCFAPTREAAREWMNQFQSDMVMKNQFRGKTLFASNGLIFKDIQKVGWDDVVLDDKTKKDIRLNTLFFFGNERLIKAGVNKRGIVLYGPPGTGKTSIVKAVFSELDNKNISRIYVTPESFKYMNVSTIFDMLSYLGPTIFVFEDIDFIGADRGGIHVGSSGLLGDLLTNLDGMRKYNDPIVIIATTNRIEALDDALANRPSRFDRKIKIGLPDRNYLKILYGKLLNQDVLDDILELSDGFTGSHVVEAVNTAKILAANENKETMESLKEACQIIRENFFPGESTFKLKAAIQSRLIKTGSAKMATLAVDKLEKEFDLASKKTLDKMTDEELKVVLAFEMLSDGAPKEIAQQIWKGTHPYTKDRAIMLQQLANFGYE